MFVITSLRAPGLLSVQTSAATARSLWASLQVAFRRRSTRLQEAAEVRALARRVRDSDPGFASDLLAAADRHEDQTA